MKYKVGDKVRIKTNLSKYDSPKCCVTGDMVDMEGQEHIIEQVGKLTCNYKISRNDGKNYWWFLEEMLEPVVSTLSEIKEKKLSCVIHTKTKNEAMMLVKLLGVNKNYIFDPTDAYIDFWEQNKENTCYRINNGKVSEASNCQIYAYKGETIYDFSDLFATGGVASIHDVSVSEWYARGLVCNEVKAKEIAERLERELNKQMSISFVNGTSITALPEATDSVRGNNHFNAFPNNGISAKTEVKIR